MNRDANDMAAEQMQNLSAAQEEVRELRAQVDRLEKSIDNWRAACHTSDVLGSVMQEQRDELAEVLRRLLKYGHSQVMCWDDYRPAAEQARAALARLEETTHAD